MQDSPSKTILLIRHTECVGPGYLGDFIKRRGLKSQLLTLDTGESLPAQPDAYSAVIALGGEMNAHQEKEFPFLKAENDFIRTLVEKKIPYLGICLGGQLLAKAMNGVVTKNAVPEFGPHEIALTEAGQKDPLFAGFPKRFPFCQWHGDTFSQLPDKAVLLAEGNACKHQAFRYGTNAYGLQFHPEVTALLLAVWCRDFGGQLNSSRQAHEIQDRFAVHAAECIKHSERLFKNFFQLSGV